MTVAVDEALLYYVPTLLFFITQPKIYQHTMKLNDTAEKKPTGIYNYFEGATINNLVINNGSYTKNGTEHHYYGKDNKKNQSTTDSEEEVKNVLYELVEAKNEDGKPLLTYNAQWYAVYRVLNEFRNYPTKMSDFCQKMAEWDMDKVQTPCKYGSVRAGAREVPKLTTGVENWQQFAELTDAYKKQCDVANFMMERLNIAI